MEFKIIPIDEIIFNNIKQFCELRKYKILNKEVLEKYEQKSNFIIQCDTATIVFITSYSQDFKKAKLTSILNKFDANKKIIIIKNEATNIKKDKYLEYNPEIINGDVHLLFNKDIVFREKGYIYEKINPETDYDWLFLKNKCLVEEKEIPKLNADLTECIVYNFVPGDIIKITSPTLASCNVTVQYRLVA